MPACKTRRRRGHGAPRAWARAWVVPSLAEANSPTVSQTALFGNLGGKGDVAARCNEGGTPRSARARQHVLRAGAREAPRARWRGDRQVPRGRARRARRRRPDPPLQTGRAQALLVLLGSRRRLARRVHRPCPRRARARPARLVGGSGAGTAPNDRRAERGRTMFGG